MSGKLRFRRVDTGERVIRGDLRQETSFLPIYGSNAIIYTLSNAFKISIFTIIAYNRFTHLVCYFSYKTVRNT